MFRSPEKRCGKTTALDLVGQLLAVIPDGRVWISVHDTNVEALLAALTGPTTLMAPA